MAVFVNGKTRLNFEKAGSGPAVIMLHGFGMSAKTCWIDKGWFDLLSKNGFRAIALDSRGHGQSDKPLVSDAYAADLMTSDALRLMDHLDIDQAHFIGHSMGARTSFDVALKHPARVASLFAISVGANLFAHVDSATFIKALDKSDPDNLPSNLTNFADMLLSLGNKLEPLKACLSSPRAIPVPLDLAAIDQPVFIATGSLDPIVRNPRVVASTLPAGQSAVINGFEHTDILTSEDLQYTAIDFLQAAEKARSEKILRSVNP